MVRFLTYLLAALSGFAGFPENAEAQDKSAAAENSAAVPTKAKTKKAKPAKKLAVEAFASLPFVEEAELSPDGTHVAGLFGMQGERRIVIRPLNKQAGKPVIMAVPDENEVNWVRWVNDDNIIVGVTALMRVQSDRWYVSRLFAINRPTGKATKLLWRLGGQDAADVLFVPSDGSNDILVAAQGTIYSNLMEFWPTVYRVNVETGKKRRVVNGKINVLDWGADHRGNVRLGISYQDSSRKSGLLYAKEGSRAFRTVERADLGEDERLTVPFLFLPGTDNGYVLKDNDQGKTAIVEVNLLTGEDVRTVYAAEKGEVNSVLLSYDRSKMLGAKIDGGKDKIHWFDPGLAEIQKTLDGSVKNAKVRIESFNRDQSRMMVRISSPDNPGLLYVYDAPTNSLSKLASANRAIGNRRLARPKLVQYKARDGLEIEGVLTLPRGREAKNLPFIVMPHGGPWAHDRLTYDYWVQFLANRGYAILQPNFRGSTGYGTEFLKAGEGQMGLAMQDDVTDGVKWAVEKGIADPARVCIVGASYGGYAAMWGIAKDPDLYRCAISIAGVAHVRKEVNDFGSSIRRRLFRDQWRRMAPDFKAISPIYAVDRIKAPLLLVHGKKDVTVDHVQSIRMNKAMRKAGKDVEFVSIPLADHYFSREEDRLKLLKSMEAFLAEHNPAD